MLGEGPSNEEATHWEEDLQRLEQQHRSSREDIKLVDLQQSFGLLCRRRAQENPGFTFRSRLAP
jgi:hypothetical protein